MTAWNLIEAQPRDAHGRVRPTPRQRQIVQTIVMLTRHAGYPPTIREVVDVHGFATPNAVMGHLRSLRRKGWVIWEPGKARTLRVTGRMMA